MLQHPTPEPVFFCGSGACGSSDEKCCNANQDDFVTLHQQPVLLDPVVLCRSCQAPSDAEFCGQTCKSRFYLDQDDTQKENWHITSEVAGYAKAPELDIGLAAMSVKGVPPPSILETPVTSPNGNVCLPLEAPAILPSPKSAAAGGNGVKKPEPRLVGNANKSCWPTFGEKFGQEEMMENLWWCTYCCCGGFGCTEVPRQISLRCGCLLCSMDCETQPWDRPSICTCIQTCAWCSVLGQLPPRLGYPRCYFWGHDFCGVVGGYAAALSIGCDSLQQFGIAHYDKILDEQFKPAYCCCCGFAVGTQVVNIINVITKCCCCRCQMHDSLPGLSEGALWCRLQCWYCHSQCAAPPVFSSNPICALFGYRWRHKDGRYGIGTMAH